jgi:signal recognition particle subunit SRP54
MFDELTDKLNATFKKLRGHGKLRESNIEEALREVRMSLLAADVNFVVVRDFVARVKERALGKDVLASLTPAQQFIKIVHDELGRLMGSEGRKLDLAAAPPVSIMVCGLQGSGKTTTVAKLGLLLKKEGRKPYLVPADVYRPAAIQQLQILGTRLELPVHPSQATDKPEDICRAALDEARRRGHDTVLVDTAGRLHVDDEMMDEVARLRALVEPREILFVADAMTGQDAVKVADAFNQRLAITGTVLTKMDGDARGGAALSIVAVTGKPIKFVGMGEKPDALEAFHPGRVASRILGMGDMITLIEKAQSTYDEEQARRLEKKIKRDDFSLEDFRDSMAQVRKMGQVEDLLKLIPGMAGQLKQMQQVTGETPDKELRRVEAIVNSMTPQERRQHAVINGSRRKRIARGSGTRVEDVNRLVKQYLQTRKLMKRFKKMGWRGFRGVIPGM